MIKTIYSKEEIINIVKQMFPNNQVMFMYYSGSIAYGTSDENSDIDVTAIIDGFKGHVQINYPNLDLFIYGSDCYLDRFRFKEDVPLYSIVKMDDVLTIDQNLINLNPDYINEYNIYKTVDFNYILKPFLLCFLRFQKVKRISFLVPDKSMYHIFRIRGIIENYSKSNKFEMIIVEPWKTKMFDFKKNWNNVIGKSYLNEIEVQLQFINNNAQRM